MFGRLFGAVVKLFKGLAKGLIAFIVALAVGTPLNIAFGFISPQAIVLTGVIFSLILLAWSRSSRGWKLAGAVGFLAYVLMTLTSFPGLARLEDAAAAELNRKAEAMAQKLEMPKKVDCAEPFLDPKSGEAVKFYRINRDGAFECFDRAGVIGGDDLRHATKDTAYAVARLKPAPTPPPAGRPAPVRVAEAPPPKPAPTPLPPDTFRCDENEDAREACAKLR
jgi:hypothetical protein